MLLSGRVQNLHQNRLNRWRGRLMDKRFLNSVARRQRCKTNRSSPTQDHIHRLRHTLRNIRIRSVLSSIPLLGSALKVGILRFRIQVRQLPV